MCECGCELNEKRLLAWVGKGWTATSKDDSVASRGWQLALRTADPMDRTPAVCSPWPVILPDEAVVFSRIRNLSIMYAH